MKESTLQANGYPAWEQNPEVFQINKRAAHSDIIPYQSEEDAKAYRLEKKREQNLNGIWKFLFFENSEQYGEKFPDGLEKVLDTKYWGTIQVPSNWQFEGYDYPQYVNVKYPWELDEDIMPPQVPHGYNPIGIYALDFQVSKEDGKNQYLRFEGIESCGEVYINGNFVGYSQGSFTPAEYDITEFLKNGWNQLVVKVIRWCDGSWLEDQDFFRLSGIFRDVKLYQLPKEHIGDYWLNGALDSSYQNGVLEVDVTLEGSEDGIVDIKLFDKSHKQIGMFTEHAVNGKIHHQIFIGDVEKWSGENPYLYTAVLQMKGQDEVLSCRVGFRKFEMIDGIMKLNGERVIFKGVNRHEFGAEFGRAITKETMIKDALTMKRNNINAVRTSHYPNHPYWYDLCDEYGIYMVDETNLETHGSWAYGVKENDQLYALPGSHSEWKGAVLDRVSDMFYRDRNHPAVLIWSLGNESFGGTNFRAMADFLRERDTTRLIHYEGCAHCEGYDDVSDMISRMYIVPEEWEKMAKGHLDKPAILCEYAHAMGNSCGNMKKYVDLFERYPQLQGGFIWDYVDQAIWAQDECGKHYLGYGGDFKERYHDGNFSGNGLVFADRTESPKLWETKICYQNMDFEMVDWAQGILRVYNKYLFTALSSFVFIWKLMWEEKEICSGSFTIDGKAGEWTEVELPLRKIEAEGEWFFTVEACLKEAADWADAGHVVAAGQIQTGCRKAPIEDITSDSAKLSVKETYGTIIISGMDFSYRLSKRTGALYSLKKNGKEYLKEPVTCNFWRASTDNDRGSKQSYRSMVWRYAGSNANIWTEITEKEEDHICIKMKFLLPTLPDNDLTVNIRVDVSGKMAFDCQYHGVEGLPDVPEIGMIFILPKEFDRFNWFGRGPHENYIDKKESAFVGVYQEKVKDRLIPYLMPQECGNMTEVRRLTISGRGGESITFTGLPYVETNVLPYTPEELEVASHQKDLPISDKTVVRVNGRQTGVGGDDSWSINARAHEEFRISGEKDYSFKFEMNIE